jgi:hypothetical protein
MAPSGTSLVCNLHWDGIYRRYRQVLPLSVKSPDLNDPKLPDCFPVAVIMERTAVSGNPWIDHPWQAVGVAVDGEPDREEIPVDGKGATRRVLHHGFLVRLFVDECESYYHNLLSPSPSCYVIASLDLDDVPIPRYISLSFDEAHAYLEGEEELFSVDMPPELYRWTEAFVLAHYVPQKRTKRKLKNWSEEGRSSP